MMENKRQEYSFSLMTEGVQSPLQEEIQTFQRNLVEFVSWLVCRHEGAVDHSEPVPTPWQHTRSMQSKQSQQRKNYWEAPRCQYQFNLALVLPSVKQAETMGIERGRGRMGWWRMGQNYLGPSVEKSLLFFRFQKCSFGSSMAKTREPRFFHAVDLNWISGSFASEPWVIHLTSMPQFF